MEYQAQLHGRQEKGGDIISLLFKPCCVLTDDLSEEAAIIQAREAGEKLAHDESAASGYKLVFTLYAIHRRKEEGEDRDWIPIWVAEAANEATAL